MLIQGIVRLPYADISGVYQSHVSKFHVFLVRQHDADLVVKTTHCHFIIDLEGVFANLDSYRKWFKSLSPTLKKGIYELHTETQELPHRPYDKLLLTRYILKGEQPNLSKGFSEAELITIIGTWQLEQIEQAPEVQRIPQGPAARAPTHWDMLLEMLDEPSSCFGSTGDQLNCYTTKPKDQVVDIRDLKNIVIKVLKRHRVCPHPKTINNMIGSMINMVDDDVNYNGYEEACVRGYTYKFSN